MKKLLIVVDYQNDFVDGALGFPGAEKLDDIIAGKIQITEKTIRKFYFGCTDRTIWKPRKEENSRYLIVLKEPKVMNCTEK